MEDLYLELGYNGIEYLIAQLQTLNDYDVPSTPIDGGGSGFVVNWGKISGNIANQKDLMNILNKLEKEVDDAISKISSVLTYKGTVATVADLPENAEIGDCWNVEENGANYAWNGTEWDKLSETIDLTNYVTQDELALYYLKTEVNDLINALNLKFEQDLADKADTSYVIELNNSVVDGVNAEISARKAADTNLQTNIDKVAQDLADHIAEAETGYITNAQFNEEIAVREQAESDLQDAIDKVADDLQKHIDDAETGYVTNAQLSEAVTALENADTTLQSNIDKKTDKEITSANGKALIFNEADGGGAKFEGATRNSFAGVNDMTDPNQLGVQLYNIDKDTKVGPRINLTAERATYSINKTELGADYEILIKKDLNNYYDKAEVDDLIQDMDVGTLRHDLDEEIQNRQTAEGELQDAIDKVADDLQKHIDDAETGYVTNAQLSETKAELEEGIGLVADNLSTFASETETNLNKKTDKEITSANGKALIFNEVDGGGAKFEGTERNSFAGVNDMTDPNRLGVQLYNIDKTTKAGPRINLTADRATYSMDTTKVSAEYEIAVKKDLTDLSDEINERIDTISQDLVAMFHYKGSKQTYEELLEVENPEIGDVYNVEETGANYAFDGSAWDKLSETIDLTPYATNAALSEVSNNVSILANTVESISATVDDSLAHQDGNIQAIVLQMEELQAKINDLKSLDYEVVTLYEGGETYYDNEEKSFQLSGEIHTNTNVTGKDVTLDEAKSYSSYLEFTALEDITIKDVEVSGIVYKNNSNALIKLHSDGYISIRDCLITPETAYNGIEIGLTEGLARSVIIDNVRFDGNFSNNGINIFGMDDGGVVTISNCYFKKLSNLLRLSNRSNTHWTVNLINCVCDEWELGQYAGMILLQDYTSGSAEQANINDMFSKLTINIQNCTKPDGTKILPVSDLSTICGTQDDNQIIYVWDAWRNFVPYSPVYPTINII